MCRLVVIVDIKIEDFFIDFFSKNINLVPVAENVYKRQLKLEINYRSVRHNSSFLIEMRLFRTVSLSERYSLENQLNTESKLALAPERVRDQRGGAGDNNFFAR
jgi:hypothetical protein